MTESPIAETRLHPEVATDTPRHRYTADLAGEIELDWQRTWARLGTAPPAVTGSIVTSASKPPLTWRYA